MQLVPFELLHFFCRIKSCLTFSYFCGPNTGCLLCLIPYSVQQKLHKFPFISLLKNCLRVFSTAVAASVPLVLRHHKGNEMFLVCNTFSCFFILLSCSLLRGIIYCLVPVDQDCFKAGCYFKPDFLLQLSKDVTLRITVCVILC